MRLRKLFFALTTSVVATACTLMLAPVWTWHNEAIQSTVAYPPIQLQNGNLLQVSQEHFNERRAYLNEFNQNGQIVRSVSAIGLTLSREHAIAEFNGYIYFITNNERPGVAKMNLADGSITSLFTPIPVNEGDTLYIHGIVATEDSVWVMGNLSQNIDSQPSQHAVLWSLDAADTASLTTLENIRWITTVTDTFPQGGFALSALYTDDYVASSGFSSAVLRVDNEQNLHQAYQLQAPEKFMAADNDGFYLIQALDTERDEIRFNEWQGTFEQRWAFNEKLTETTPRLLAHEGDKIMIEDGRRLHGATTGIGQTWSRSLDEENVTDPVFYLTETSFNDHVVRLDDGKAIVAREHYKLRPYGLPIANYYSKVTATHTELYEMYNIDGTLLKTFADPAYLRVVNAPACGNFDCGSEQSPHAKGVCYTWALTPMKGNRFASSNLLCTGDFAGANPGVSVFSY